MVQSLPLAKREADDDGAGNVRGGLPVSHDGKHHYPACRKDRRGNHQDDRPFPTHSRVLWSFGCWPATPILRGIPLPESVDVGLRSIKEGSSTAYSNGVAAVGMGAVVTIDDVLFPFDKREATTAAGRWRGDVTSPHGPSPSKRC